MQFVGNKVIRCIKWCWSHRSIFPETSRFALSFMVKLYPVISLLPPYSTTSHLAPQQPTCICIDTYCTGVLMLYDVGCNLKALPLVLLPLFATDESSCFRPVVDLCCLEENLQDTVEVTCGSLIIQTIMKSLWKERKTQCHYTVSIHFRCSDVEYEECAQTMERQETTATNYCSILCKTSCVRR